MTNKQPEALRLAELLELAPEDGIEPQTTEDAAAELRRLHTENTALQQGYAAARLEIESLRGRSVPVSEADMVLAAMETGEWELQRLLPQTCFTSEANIRNAWSVKRSAAPYCTKDGLRIWTGATPLEALCNGAAALGVELPGCSETAALPKTAVAILGEQAELRRLSDCCPELNLSNYGPDDVDELNGWAIEVSQCIDRAMRAAQPAGAQQPGAVYAALPYKQALGSTNCMQCCVSYMMGLPLENVPDFATDGGWERFSDFAETQGYVAVMLPGNREYEADYLASGTTARGTSHMVVMNDGKLVHDPHPSNAGLVDVQCVWLLAKRASPTQWQQDEHTAFEASAKTYTSNVSFERDASDYVDMTASLLWHGWKLRASHGQAPAQAAPAAVAVPTFEDFCKRHGLDPKKMDGHGGMWARVALDECRAITQPAPQADSVLEDAARLDWLALAGPTSICVVIDRPHDSEVEVATDDVTGYGKTLREAIDDARKQGANHD